MGNGPCSPDTAGVRSVEVDGLESVQSVIALLVGCYFYNGYALLCCNECIIVLLYAILLRILYFTCTSLRHLFRKGTTIVGTHTL